MRHTRSIAIILAALLLLGFAIVFTQQFLVPPTPIFDGQRAYQDVIYQVQLGARTPGSTAHSAAVDWMASSLHAAGWQVEIQEFEQLGHPIRNVIAKRGSGAPWLLLGAHYDSRLFADQDADPSMQSQPVPGANDGASGVAVLLELARVLPRDLQGQVWLVLFDAEDNGGIESWDWILGSTALAESLTALPDSVVIVDMIGDAELQIYLEANSDETLSAQIWEQAAVLGHDGVFINAIRHSMLDDHTPFLRLGIPAVDIIDFDYPHWHTTQDTADKVSAQSLQLVGETLLAWIIAR